MSSNASLSTPVLKTNQESVDAEAVAIKVSIILFTLTVVLGIVGNSLVIWVAGFKLKPNVTNVWLVNLAVADLIFCFTRLLSLVKKLFFVHWPYGVFLCKFNGFFKYANMFCSVFLLAVISADRALCIWQPFFAKRRRTLLAARVVAAGVWAAAVVLSSPYFVYRRVTNVNNVSKCSVGADDRHSGTTMALYANRFLCGFLLPFMVILTCYILAGVGIRRTRLLGKSRPLRILASLVVAFFLCWAPYHCVQLVKMVNEKNAALKVVSPVAAAVAYFNSCINPLLYFCMGLQARGRSRQSLTAVYRRALEDDVDRQMSLQRSLDNSTTSRHSSGAEAGRGLAAAALATPT